MASGTYRLDLVTTKAFARRYKKDAVMASQGEGDLPAPWAGHTLTEETLGDIFADPIGGHLHWACGIIRGRPPFSSTPSPSC